MTDPGQRVAELLKVFEDPRACAAELLCDRHPGTATALTIVESDLSYRDVTFAEMRESSTRFAAGLAELGVGRQDRVATLMGKSAELIIAMLAIWRLGAVHVPLFTAFAPPAIAARITGNGTKVVIADPSQRTKLEPSPDLPADADWRIVTAGEPARDDLAFHDLLRTSPPRRAPYAAGGDTCLIELFTSGTTGSPKGVPIPLRALAAIQMYQEYGLDHQPGDVFWNAADPGWAYGLYYAIIGPLTLGHRSLLLHAPFTPESTWSVLSTFGVTNFTAGPTVYRSLRNTPLPALDGSRLRHCSSAGEPLGPDVIAWAEKTLGVPILDHYGQTELGMAVANAWHPDLRAELRPGSMGQPLPGWNLDVLEPDTDTVASAGQPGRLAVDLENSPLMWFTGYRNAPERTAERFTRDRRWYLTGDTAVKDNHGYVFFTSRDDDIILTAGYRIGPFEVETVLVQHDDVAEAAVVGAPDQLRGEIVVAYVVLRPDATPSDALVAELQQLVKTRLAAHAYPREIRFIPQLPKTSSGKIQRYVLRHKTAERNTGTSHESP